MRCAQFALSPYFKHACSSGNCCLVLSDSTADKDCLRTSGTTQRRAALSSSSSVVTNPRSPFAGAAEQVCAPHHVPPAP